MRHLIRLAVLLLLFSAPAWADNPAPAYWQGSRTSGHGACFSNSGQGITLQDASAGACTFAGGLTIAAPLSSVATVTPTFTSQTTAPTGTITNGATASYYQGIFATNDTVDSSSAQGGGVTTLYVNEVLAAGAVGQRTTELVQFNQTGATTVGAGFFYTALAAQSFSRFSAGGTTGVGNARGNLFGILATSSMLTGSGSFWNSAVGIETDVGVASGNGVVYKIGNQIVQLNTDSVSGSSEDAALEISNQSGGGSPPGWDVGITFTSPKAWFAIKSTGTLIGAPYTPLAGGPSVAAAHGIDFSNVTFSSDAFKSTGFSVSGTGVVISDTHEATGSDNLLLGNVTHGVGIQMVDPAGAIVNQILMKPNVTGGATIISNGGAGADANVGFVFGLKGAGTYAFYTDGATSGATSKQFAIGRTASAVDQITVTGGATGSPGTATVSATGSDTDIDLVLTSKGAGVVKFGNSASFVANGSVATTMTSLGPAGSHTTIQEWLAVKDSAGTIRYIPAY